MKSQITLIGNKISIDVDQPDFYESMLGAIAGRVFQLLGPGFDKEAFLKEVEKRGSAVVIGQELAVPVSILLSMELVFNCKNNSYMLCFWAGGENHAQELPSSSLF